MARDTAPSSPDITLLKIPPIVMADVSLPPGQPKIETPPAPAANGAAKGA
jgi:hypothetical protein